MFETAKLFVETFKTSYKETRIKIAEHQYEAEIAASQAKLAETKLVPGYTKIYA